MMDADIIKSHFTVIFALLLVASRFIVCTGIVAHG